MIVKTPNFSGDIVLPVREVSAGDYWFVVIDKEKNTYSAHDIAQADTSDDGFWLTFDVSLSIAEGKQYVYYMFTNDGTMTTTTGTADSFYEDLTTYAANITEIARGRLFCTSQTNFLKYTTTAQAFDTNDTDADNQFIINE